MFCSIEQDLHKQKYREPQKENLTKEEYPAIRSLKNSNEIIIKPADKGSAIVIIDKISYINGQKQLNNTQLYEPTETDLTGEVIHRANLHKHCMPQKVQISQNSCSYLTTDIDRTQHFHMLPMIYKGPKNSPGRPIFTICASLHRTLGKNSIPYSQFLILRRIHSVPQYLLEVQIKMNLFFLLRKYPHTLILKPWELSSAIPKGVIIDFQGTHHSSKNTTYVHHNMQ